MEEPELPTLPENEGIAELFKTLQIDKNQLLDQNQKQQLKTLIYQYHDVFAPVEGEVGATTLT